MKRKLFLTALLLSLLLLSSCFNQNYPKLYKKGEYERVAEITDALLKEGIDEKNLYYSTVAQYKLNERETTRKKAELYYYLFDDGPKEHRINVLRLIMYLSEPELAYEAAKELISKSELSKADNIQYYKILNDNSLFTAASKHLAEISPQLTPGEAVFAVINGNAPTWQILSSLDNLYSIEGVSKDFVSAIKLALPIVVSRDGLEYIPILLKDTYDGSADYSIVLGDFYYAVGDNASAIKYWSNAAPIYPDLIREREKLVLR